MRLEAPIMIGAAPAFDTMRVDYIQSSDGHHVYLLFCGSGCAIAFELSVRKLHLGAQAI
jgi:hypothetical protein